MRFKMYFTGQRFGLIIIAVCLHIAKLNGVFVKESQGLDSMLQINEYLPKTIGNSDQDTIDVILESESLYFANESLIRSRRNAENLVEGSGGEIPDTGTSTASSPPLYTEYPISTLCCDDVTSSAIYVPFGIPYGTRKHYRIYVSTNGIISFSRPMYSYYSRFRSRYEFIAPFWSDIHPGRGGRISYSIFDRYSWGYGNGQYLSQFTNHIRLYRRAPQFTATWALLVTYYQVLPSWSTSLSQFATFQVAIVTNGFETYAIYLYEDMRWIYRGRSVFIGYNQNRYFRRILYSGYSAAYRINRYIGNSGLYGFWIYRIGYIPNPAQLCLNWYYRNRRNTVTQTRIRRLPTCPCNQRRMRFDRRWYLVSRTRFRACYRSRFSWRSSPSGKDCCYRFGRFIRSGRRFSGPSYAYHPSLYRFRRLYYTEDYLPRRHCCQQSNRYCYLYNRLRPNNVCYRIRIIIITWAIGDPHITTLDGKNYIFNGLGEYTLFRNNTFVLQGRTERAATSDGSLSNATIFSAFAVKDDSGAKFQVELNANKTGMVIYGLGRDLTVDFYENDTFEFVDETGLLSVMKEGDAVVAVFGSGITLSVLYRTQLLGISLNVPEEFMNMAEGLMGNFNKDPNDDFTLPNGTTLSPNITEKQIYSDFGQKWLIKPSESVFQYPARKGPEDFSFPNFKPIFFEDQTDDVKTKAASACGSSNIACMYDFIATGRTDLANSTRNELVNLMDIEADNENSDPEINGTTLLNATVGEAAIINVSGSDEEDGENVIYFVEDEPDSNFSFDNQTRMATWTPLDTKPVNLTFYVEDSKKVQSAPLEVQIRLCNGCSGHGDCDHSQTIQDPDEEDDPSFQLVACICHTGWTGDNCNEDFDGCADSPCLPSQNCTDKSPEEHRATNISFECSPCPDGYIKDNDSQKCQDIDECNSKNNCEQICENTDGGYSCSCKNGYRKQGFGACKDINECEEKGSDCEQICTNIAGGFNCSCYSGYTLNSNGKGCTADNTRNSCLRSKNCSQLCVGDDDSNYKCECKIGYTLKADKSTCENLNECSALPKPCSHICSDNEGSYTCSCLPGFILADDNSSCEVCPEFTYGEECSKTCQCGEHGTECDNVRGCICESGWKGENCTTDIDECADQTHNCSADTICENTDGGFECTCRTGFVMENGACKDIDECEDPEKSDCGQICQNTEGSFSCSCQVGYKTNSTSIKECVDIDECEAGINQCEQFCDNVEGSYNCRCEFGFRLTANRKNCEKVEDVCAKFSNLSCSYACNISTDEQTANCYCQRGYKLANDKQTCQDIDECKSDSTNLCTHTCNNEVGSYSCSCPIGKKLENNKRTCTDCDANHWGEYCGNECNCGIGASTCDKITGCKCKSGWSGDRCDQDIDECNRAGICPTSSICRNTPGNYTCTCSSGYKLEGNTCVDINECDDEDLNTCEICNNTVGSYFCSCHTGFVYKDGKCQDINECEVSKDNCEHSCRNTLGSFVCECRNGFKLSDEDRGRCTPTGITNCSRKDCELCEKMSNGTEACFCKRGFKLNNDQTCSDINECDAEPCNNGTCTQNAAVPGDFSCSCSTGYELAEDKVTCAECKPGTYGPECNGTCDCENINTKSCSTTDGKCSCKTGWTGKRCDEDTDECKSLSPPSCTQHSTCVNTNGSYVCTCQTGFVKTGGTCTECKDQKYGENCQKSCSCIVGNVDSCDNVNGTCYCKKEWKGSNCETDVNECENANTCSSQINTKCVNIDGGYRCDCQEGYTKAKNGSCQDKNECADVPCQASEVCNNNVGNYTCDCPKNSHYVNGSCSEKTGCSLNNGGCDHTCNEVGVSIVCSCRTRYTLNNDNKTCVGEPEMDYAVAVGFGVGIPLIFFAILLIAFLVYRRVRSRNRGTEPLVNERNILAALPTRTSYAAANYMAYVPDGLSVASSSDSGSKRHKRRKGRSDFRDSAWYDNQGTASDFQTPPKSSWNYLQNVMLPDDKFEIRRPQVSEIPNDAFSNGYNSLI